jgi:protein-tyrosine phosphatase
MADPWYGGAADFELTRDQVLASTPGVVDFVRARLRGERLGTSRIRTVKRPDRR